MKKNKCLYIGCFLYLLAIILMFFLLINEISLKKIVVMPYKLLLYIFLALLFIISEKILRKYNDAIFGKLKKRNILIGIVFILIFIVNHEFLMYFFNRNPFNIYELKYYIFKNTNIIPVRNVIYGWNGFKKFIVGYYKDFLLYMPFAILPFVFERYKKVFIYLIDIFTFSLVLNEFRVLATCGSFDIDRILLNVLGALLAYLIVNKTKFKNVLKNLL